MIATNATDCQRRERARYRPPAGVPLERRGWWGAALSLLAHLVLLLLLVGPVWHAARLAPPPGAGGAGPSGGGGGGSGGARARAAGAGERLHYVRVRANPTPPAADRAPVERAQPVLKPPPTPRLQPPKAVPEPPRERVQPVAPTSTPSSDMNLSIAPRISVATGGAGDSGASAGTGPGRGGGTGSGVGTGRGSATGPGTGGGEGSIYPATPDFLVMPALPVPSGVRGKIIQLRFKLDERGSIVELTFDPTGDSSYDKELRSRLLEYRFRPAHKLDGTPVPSVYVTELTL